VGGEEAIIFHPDTRKHDTHEAESTHAITGANKANKSRCMMQAQQ